MAALALGTGTALQATLDTQEILTMLTLSDDVSDLTDVALQQFDKSGTQSGWTHTPRASMTLTQTDDQSCFPGIS